ncbi:MAG: SDR family NAD(P)-dependent oxidoreductase [Lachnospiraceae bacterium]|nr:SDR family NAD(P)-dependent oxidoreductase [Lachnospiraceae bacterium]
MKTALITGSARGIGRALAISLAHDGYNLILNTGHDEAALISLKEEIIGITGCEDSCIISIGDVGQSSYVTELIDIGLKQFGFIDVLINNAGVSYVGLLTDMTDEDISKVVNTNLIASIYTARAVIPSMVNRKAGHIINVSSMWGVVGASCETVYSATKGGLNTFTKALAKELAPSNIQVNAVTLGVIDTDMNKCFSEEEREALTDEIPMGRMAKPSEVADLILNLIKSPSYLTGSIIDFDGGWI